MQNPRKAMVCIRKSIRSYQKSLDLKPDPNIYMIIGNLYDEKLTDRAKAIYYYQKFLDNLGDSKMNFTSEYIDTVKERLEYLKANPGRKVITGPSRKDL